MNAFVNNWILTYTLIENALISVTAFFNKWAIPGHFFFIFRLFYKQLTVNKSCQRLDSNPGSLVSEVTALPTAPQPLPNKLIACKISNVFVLIPEKEINIITIFQIHVQCNPSNVLFSVIRLQRKLKFVEEQGIPFFWGPWVLATPIKAIRMGVDIMKKL